MSWIEVPKYRIVGDFDLNNLGVDDAYFQYSNNASTDLWLYQVSTNCFKCPYTRLAEIRRNSVQDTVIHTAFPIKFRFRTDGSSRFAPQENDSFTFCDVENRFGEFGVYNWYASGNESNPQCVLSTIAEPVNIYFPLLIAVLFYAVLLTLCYVVGGVGYRQISRLSRRSRASGSRNGNVNQGFLPSPDTNSQTASSSPASSPNSVPDKTSLVSNGSNGNKSNPSTPTSASASSPQNRPRQRLRSLDAFRGISIVIMIFVNYGGGQYYFFEHATWDGLYVADLVFPWFLWIMGVCIPISVKSQVKRGTPKLEIIKTIAIRSAKLIAVGLILGTVFSTAQFGENPQWRLPGVLQRFGVCYFVCATLVLLCMSVNIVKPVGNKLMAAIQDIQILWISWIIVLLIVLTHCLITFLLKIPGCPEGYLGPGGLHNNLEAGKNCTGGAAGYLDMKIFTAAHIYRWPTSAVVYESDVYDPEGFLGTLTSIFQVWMGVQAGATMMVYPRPSSRLIRWGIWAVLTGGIGALLCGGKEMEGWIPVNKNLWSLSYTLVTASFSFILLSFLYIFIDIKKWWSGSPFFEPGMNSILLYVGHSVLSNALPFHWKLERMATHFIHLTENLWGTSLWVLVAIYFHRKKKYYSL